MTQQNGQLSSENIQGAVNKLYGDFKGYRDRDFTFGQIQPQNGNELKYFIETGKASMIMIHGVRTLIRTAGMTSSNIENVTRIWERKNER